MCLPLLNQFDLETKEAFSYMHSLLFVVYILLFTFLSLQQVDVVKVGGSSLHLSSRRLSQTCSNEDISVNHKNVGSSNGIFLFDMEIVNECSFGCAVVNIHVNCGDFTSGVEVIPQLFRKLAIGDFLVNDDHKLDVGEIVSFTYSNTFSFPLTVTSVTCVD